LLSSLGAAAAAAGTTVAATTAGAWSLGRSSASAGWGAGPASSRSARISAAPAMRATTTRNSRVRSPSASGRLKNRRSRSTISAVVAVEGFALALAHLTGAAHDVLV
jgi:hypothetical protein